MLREYIYDEELEISILNNKIDIYNYEEIISFSDTLVTVKCPNFVMSIKGTNLSILKMIKDELLIQGKISNIEFR